MKILILGGSGSGKSAYAEELAMKLKKDKVYYIACMMPYGQEAERRIKRHRRLREGKGFTSVEQYRDIDRADVGGTVIIESMSTLLANEMFGSSPKDSGYVLRCTDNIKADNIIVVSDNVAEDGAVYSQDTVRYIEEMNALNTGLALWADRVTEVVCGIAVNIK